MSFFVNLQVALNKITVIYKLYKTNMLQEAREK
jgi:hypothetical protein